MKHLYLIGSHTTGLDRIKIGVSSNPALRIKQLQTGNYETYIFFMCQLINSAEKVEGSLHVLLEPYKIKNEWFELPSDVLEAVKQILWALDLACECGACSGVVNRRILGLPSPARL